MKVAAIKAPSYGEERRQLLEDLSISVGATFVTRESGTKLNNVEMKHFGSAKFIESSQYRTTIVGGVCDTKLVDEKIESLKAAITQTEDLEQADSAQKRISRLASGVAVIRVGGSTEVEMTERKHRIEDALEAVRSAQEEGIVAGGGVALLRSSQAIAIVSKEASPDIGLGAAVVKIACEEPIRQMAQNAGASADLIIDKVLSSESKHGWDFRSDEIVNLIDVGIIDPVKVTKTALINGASCAATLMTTNFGIIQTEDK